MQFGFGSGLLWGARNDVSPATPVRFGALQDVQFDFKGEVKELFGQYQFPLDSARGKVKITGKAKFAQINALMYNQLFFGQTIATGMPRIAYDETHPVPTTPFEVVVTNGATFVDDLGVRYKDTGEYLQQVAAGSEATGKYSVDKTTGTYTFATGDTGKSLYFDYEWTDTTGYSIAGSNLLMGSAPRFKGVFTEVYENNVVTLILNRCICPDMSLPTKIDDYVIQDISIEAFADASNNVFTLGMTSGSLG